MIQLQIHIWTPEKMNVNIWYSSLCLQLQRLNVSCSFSAGLHTLQEGFWPSPSHRSSLDQSGKILGWRWETESLSSLQRFSIGFRSGDWLVGHARTLICFLQRHSLVILAVCFGSLSCWKTQPRPIFNALTEGRRLFPKISQYMAQVILSLIQCSRPVPCVETHPKSMMLPPPCFTVGMMLLGWYSSFFFLQTRLVELRPKSSILVSSDRMTPLDHPNGHWQT